MSLNNFLGSFGFTDDPFSSTNAGEEPKLSKYFVPPPYFSNVLGNPLSPRSDVVLAPRGGGKTAQRIMIEVESRRNNDLLCVTYDNFDFTTSNIKASFDLSYHLLNISRLLLIAVLSEIAISTDKGNQLSKHQKTVIKYQAKELLGTLSAAEYGAAVKSLKNVGEKASDLWDKYGGKIAGLLNAFIERYDFGKIDISDIDPIKKNQSESVRYHFQQLVLAAQALGFFTIYILVDKVDEISITAKNAKSTFNFIEELLIDLPTLETPGIGFKIFLWDQVDQYYQISGARPDRVPIHRLKWTTSELSSMLSERLKAFSSEDISSFNQLLNTSCNIDVHTLVTFLANGSPRDMIRCCNDLVAEETRISTDSPSLSEEAIWKGIKKFCDARSSELFNQFIPELRKTGAVTFTINKLASDVFRVSQQAVRSKIQKWMNAGAVSKVGEIPNPGNRPLHLYALSDLRLAIALRPSNETEMILGNYVLICTSCDELCVSDKQTISCEACSQEFDLSTAKSVLETCTSH